MYNNRIFRTPHFSPDAPASDGFVSLEDIDAEEENPAAAQKQADLEAAALQKEADDKAADDQKALDAKAAEDAKKKEDEESAASAEAGEGEDTDPENVEDGSFWDDVDKLRGEALDVDFGDVDPSTPEGALIYEKAVRMDEIAKFEQHLATTNPRAYAFMTHILDGGKEEDFFKIAGEPGTLPTEAELQNSVDIQKDILTQEYKSKGLGDKVIAATIKALVTDDELEEAATEALKNRVKAQEEGVKAIQENAKQEAALREGQIKEMNDYIGQVVNTGKIGNIIIPEKDRTAFAKEFASSIRIENGQFVSVTPVTQETAEQVFKEKFFSFKKGNIADLVEKAAATANTKRLVRTLPNGGKKPLGTGQRQESNITTMGEMED
jgi:hypothetical protein